MDGIDNNQKGDNEKKGQAFWKRPFDWLLGKGDNNIAAHASIVPDTGEVQPQQDALQTPTQRKD